MAKVLIEVTKTGLMKIKNLHICYKIIETDLELRALLFNGNSVEELADHEQEQVFKCALEAIEQGDDYGILIETLSGRNMQDHRCYELDDVSVVSAEEADVTVLEMKMAQE